MTFRVSTASLFIVLAAITVTSIGIHSTDGRAWGTHTVFFDDEATRYNFKQNSSYADRHGGKVQVSTGVGAVAVICIVYPPGGCSENTIGEGWVIVQINALDDTSTSIYSGKIGCYWYHPWLPDDSADLWCMSRDGAT